MKLSGVLPPIATPFKDGELALDRLKKNFQMWNKTSLSGYLVLGSNGEAVYLNEKEKVKVIEVSRIENYACRNRNGVDSGDDSVHQSGGKDGGRWRLSSHTLLL
jgi:hypothetical protein